MHLYDVKEILLEQNKSSLAYDHHKINNNNSKFKSIFILNKNNSLFNKSKYNYITRHINETHKLSTGNNFKQFTRNNSIFTLYFVQATRYEHCSSAGDNRSCDIFGFC